MNKFEDLIIQLGDLLEIALHAERGTVCKLNINGKMQVNMEFDEVKDLLLLGCFASDLPPGRYRENVLKEALRINSTYPRLGTFAYSERNNKLVIFTYISFVGLNPEKLNNKLQELLEGADDWRMAVDSGNLAKVALPSSGSSGTSAPPLGMKR